MKNVDLDIKIDFFKENQESVKEILKSESFFSKTLDDIIEFMSYVGIERIILSGKTPEDDKRYRENLKKRKIENN